MGLVPLSTVAIEAEVYFKAIIEHHIPRNVPKKAPKKSIFKVAGFIKHRMAIKHCLLIRQYTNNPIAPICRRIKLASKAPAVASAVLEIRMDPAHAMIEIIAQKTPMPLLAAYA
jgi:hypothetical protein